jgi:hypothetical protein
MLARDGPAVPLGLQLRTLRDHGARLSAIAPNSAASAAGLVPGDIVLAIDGRDVRTASHATVTALLRAAGATVTLRVAADGASAAYRQRVERRRILMAAGQWQRSRSVVREARVMPAPPSEARMTAAARVAGKTRSLSLGYGLTKSMCKRRAKGGDAVKPPSGVATTAAAAKTAAVAAATTTTVPVVALIAGWTDVSTVVLTRSPGFDMVFVLQALPSSSLKAGQTVVRVAEVLPNGVAARGGVVAGQVLLAINDVPCAGLPLADIMQQLAGHKQVSFTVCLRVCTRLSGVAVYLFVCIKIAWRVVCRLRRGSTQHGGAPNTRLVDPATFQASFNDHNNSSSGGDHPTCQPAGNQPKQRNQCPRRVDTNNGARHARVAADQARSLLCAKLDLFLKLTSNIAVSAAGLAATMHAPSTVESKSSSVMQRLLLCCRTFLKQASECSYEKFIPLPWLSVRVR